jgi:L-histidine Nalpha-methyltransferase
MARTTTARPDLYEATRRGLEGVPKELPPVWLYDARGSQLYEEITRLRGYYLPQREAEILGARAPEIARRTNGRTLVELGSGNAMNTRFLIDSLQSSGTLAQFVPIDVSEEMLRATARTVRAAYPGIAVSEVVGDFERDLGPLPGRGPRLIAMLGSTIGNLHPEERATLLASLAGDLADDDALLLGVDLVKDVARLRAAYNDETGVTEAFVRNALSALNRDLEATFEQRRFVYEAFWDPRNDWMDIGLRATEAHTVSVEPLELELSFDEGERLRVEISAKFRRAVFVMELERAGLTVESWWTDRANEFAVVLARPDR